MKIQIDKFKTDFKEQKAGAGIDPNTKNAHLQDVYNSEAVYLQTEDDLEKVQKQVHELCERMKNKGLTNFTALEEKFEFMPAEAEELEMLNKIKDTMEYLLYVTENSQVDATQFKDRDFLCKEGTLTNLQNILVEMSLGEQGIEAYIIEQKRQLVEQTATTMYSGGEFMDYPWIFRQYKPMEVHNVTSLVNSVADEYGLNKKDKSEDKYVREVFGNTKKKLLGGLERQFSNEETVNAFVSGIAMNLVNNLPVMTGDPGQFSQDFNDRLVALSLKNIIDPSALLVYKDYYPTGEFKANIQSIMHDAVTVYLHEQGIVTGHPNIELVKMRLAIENSLDDNFNNRVTIEVLDEAAKKGYTEQAFKYIIDNNIKLDEETCGMEDPVRYAIEHGIKIDGKDARQYVLEKIIDEYIDIADDKSKTEKKQTLENRYKEVSEMGVDQPLLLSLNSTLGKFLEDPKSVEAIAKHSPSTAIETDTKVDFTKYDLPTIAKGLKAYEEGLKATENKKEGSFKAFSEFSNLQKVAVAFSFLLGPAGPVIAYHAINYFNAKAKEEVTKQPEGKEKSSLKDIKDSLAGYVAKDDASATTTHTSKVEKPVSRGL